MMVPFESVTLEILSETGVNNGFLRSDNLRCNPYKLHFEKKYH